MNLSFLHLSNLPYPFSPTNLPLSYTRLPREYVKEDIGVVMAKTDPPLAAFATNEPNIVNAFWEYMNRHN